MIKFIRNNYRVCAALLTLSGMVIYFWAPALFNQSTIVHGETARFGIPMMAMQPNVFEPNNGILWSSSLSGGHPLFAEGQGAFANPIRYLLAESLEPILAYNAYHAISMLVGGLGVYFLSHFLGLGVGSALFSSIAATFSTGWLLTQSNHVTIGTLSWVPWFLLAAEYWFRVCSLKSSIYLAVTTFLLIVSGYPQIAHGAALYFLFSMIPELFYKDQRKRLMSKAGFLCVSGALAVVLALGLSAVQLLPLIELVSESHRSEGIEVQWPMSLDLVVRGLLFSHYAPKYAEDGGMMYTTGSMMIVTLAILVLGIKKPVRILGHLWAGFFLLNLALQNVSPIFNFFYNYHLIPGLHYFRFMGYYAPVVVIAVSICAGYTIHCFTQFKDGRGQQGESQHYSKRLVISLLVVAFGTVIVATVYDVDGFSRFNYLFVVLFAVGALLLGTVGRLRHVPLLVIVLVVLETVSLRFNPFPFVPSAIFKQPIQASAIKADADYKMYRALDTSVAKLHVMRPAHDPKGERSFQRMLSAVGPMHNLLWDIPSVDAAVSLTLKRREMIKKILLDEAMGNVPTPPGMRLLDSLSIRYLALDKRSENDSLQLISESRPGVLMYRNDFARPVVQLYEWAEANGSPEGMLKKLVDRPSLALQVEAEELPSLHPVTSNEEPALEVVSTGPKRYEAVVDSGRGVWLFIADAYYPGWAAEINGVKARLYSAQMNGKAVYLPTGRSVVVVEYFPMSFYIGVGFSLVSLVIILLILIGPWVRRKSACNPPAV